MPVLALCQWGLLRSTRMSPPVDSAQRDLQQRQRNWKTHGVASQILHQGLIWLPRVFAPAQSQLVLLPQSLQELQDWKALQHQGLLAQHNAGILAIFDPKALLGQKCWGCMSASKPSFVFTCAQTVGTIASSN